MTGKIAPLGFVSAAMIALLAGCSSNMTNSMTSTTAATAPVSISMTDDPPAGVSVLFFQVSLTGASLMSASGTSVSLLNSGTPIEVDVTQLQALSAFLSTANVAAGTYNSLNLTFANPELVIYNQSDSSLGSTCAVGSVCQLTPTLASSSSSLSISSSPFPVMISSGSPLGFAIHFHLNTVIQSDLSVNLSVANGVTASELPPAPTPQQFGGLTGTVETVTANSNQFTLQTAWGRTFTIDTTSSTTFGNFPSSSCSTPGLGCLAQGQVVRTQIAGLGTNGALTASAVTYVQQAAAVTVQGTVIRLIPSSSTASAPPTGFVMILHDNFADAMGFPMGGEATVNLASSATYSMDDSGYTMPAGLSFSSAASLTVGQTVNVTEQLGTLSQGMSSGMGTDMWGPPPSLTFTASAVELEPSQMTGMITSLDSSNMSFVLGKNEDGGMFFAPWPMMSEDESTFNFNVDTTTQTSYTGFNPESYDGLMEKQFVSVEGWLFPAAGGGGGPIIAAKSVVLRPNDSF